jgi:gluconate 2-dehydrogenase gamma chain
MTDKEKDALRDRREFLKGAISIVPAAALTFAQDAAAAEEVRGAGTGYRPSFFTADEWAFLVAATDRLIPANEDGPGAVQLGVPEFIDRQMETDYGHGGRWYLQGPFDPNADFTLGYQLRFNPRDLYRTSIAELNSWCTDKHGKRFADLDGAAQDEVLGQLQKGAIELPSVKASEFFLQLLGNTKEGYFADPMYGGNRAMGSWKMIGFPGARADFKDWVEKRGARYPLGPVSILGEKA